MRSRIYADVMWWDYVQQVAKGAKQAEIAERAGVNQVTVSRWKKGAESARPENVAAFARAYGRPVLEAFVAAGFLTAEEADVRPEARLHAADLDDTALIDEIARRLRRTTPEAGGSGSNLGSDFYQGSLRKGTPIRPAEEGEVWPIYSPGESDNAETAGERRPRPRSREVIEQALAIARSNRADLNELPEDLPATVNLKQRADREIAELERELTAARTVAG